MKWLIRNKRIVQLCITTWCMIRISGIYVKYEIPYFSWDMAQIIAFTSALMGNLYAVGMFAERER